MGTLPSSGRRNTVTPMIETCFQDTGGSRRVWAGRAGPIDELGSVDGQAWIERDGTHLT